MLFDQRVASSCSFSLSLESNLQFSLKRKIYTSEFGIEVDFVLFQHIKRTVDKEKRFITRSQSYIHTLAEGREQEKHSRSDPMRYTALKELLYRIVFNMEGKFVKMSPFWPKI